jgi:hypothetical protein
LGSAVGLAVGGHAFDSHAATRRYADLPIDDAAFNVRTLGKLQGDLSGRVTYTYNPGFVFGVVPNAGRAPEDFAQLLYRVEGVTKRISRLLDDGSVEEATRNWMVYCDADTGEYLSRFQNPYTHETLEVPPLRGSPSRARLTVRGPVTGSFPGLENSSFDKPLDVRWRLLGDSAWITRHSASRIRTASGALRNEFSIDAWICRRADLQRRNSTHVPSHYSWTSHAQWQPWLNMARYPGHMLWRIEPTVLFELADLPPALVARLEQVAPGQLAESLSW